MIGTSLAIALAPLGLKYCRGRGRSSRNADELQPSFDDRSTALSRSTQRMFEAIGSLGRGRSQAATPIRRIHVSDRGRFGFSHIDAAGTRCRGAWLRRYQPGARRGTAGKTLETLPNVENVTVFCPARVLRALRAATENVLQVSVRWVRRGKSQQLEHANCVVAADGANSDAAHRCLGIGAVRSPTTTNMQLSATCCPRNLWTTARSSDSQTQGPLALLPIAEERAAFVWIVASARLGPGDRNSTTTAFLDEIQEAFGYRDSAQFSRVGQAGPGYPLSLSKAATRLTAPRAVSSSETRRMACIPWPHRDSISACVMSLHSATASPMRCTLDASADLGDPDSCCSDTLTGVAMTRASSFGLTDGIVKLFGSSTPPLACMMRSVGMLGFDLVPWRPFAICEGT